MEKILDKVRVDKWLWSVRLFKSRSQATDACKSGKVKVNDSNAKPSQAVQADDIVKVNKQGFQLEFKVVKLIQKRVSATLAQPCYEDLTPQDEYDKYKNWYIGKGQAEKREKGAGRPTKRERREIDEYKDWTLWDE